jgi:hypothetical protein
MHRTHPPKNPPPGVVSDRMQKHIRRIRSKHSRQSGHPVTPIRPSRRMGHRMATGCHRMATGCPRDETRRRDATPLKTHPQVWFLTRRFFRLVGVSPHHTGVSPVSWPRHVTRRRDDETG